MAKKLETKPFWLSTTLWINVAGVLALVLDLFLRLNVTGHYVVDPEVIAILTALLNIVNRFRPAEKKNLTLK